jgi:hypothetical protein
MLSKHRMTANKVFSVIFHEMHLDAQKWFKELRERVGDPHVTQIGFLLLRLVEINQELASSFLTLCNVDANHTTAFFCHLRPVVERYFAQQQTTKIAPNSNSISSKSILQAWSRESLLKKLKSSQEIMLNESHSKKLTTEDI